MQEWCPFAQKVPNAQNGGAYTGGGHKIVHHTTDGWKAQHAIDSWKSNNFWSHFVDTFENGRYELYQCLPISVPARALDTKAGPTNRDNAVQIEHVWWSWSRDKPPSAPESMVSGHFPDAYLKGMTKLLRWIEEQWEVPRAAPHPFPKFHGDSVRLPWDTWHATTGHVGHCHAPGNDHTDPGRLNMDRLLGTAASKPAHLALEKYNAAGIGWEEGLIATALAGALRGEGIATMTVYKPRNVAVAANAAAKATLRKGPRLVAVGAKTERAVIDSGHKLMTEDVSDLFGAVGKGSTPAESLRRTVQLSRDLVGHICTVEGKDADRGKRRFEASLVGFSDSFADDL